jgi:thiol:disulfide interchange protein DsbC
MKLPLLAATLACVSLAALADEAEVKKAVEARLGKIEKIVKAPMAGIWEVTVDNQIYYSDDKGSYLIFGSMLDMKTGKNLTAERQFNALPLELAIKQVRGSGKNVMVTFEDPNCGY